MYIRTTWQGQSFQADLGKGIDLSIPLDHRKMGVNCFYAPLFHAEPVTMGDFVGSVAKGGAVNFYNISLNPHGNGTHTEGVGHISEDQLSVNEVLKSFHFVAELVTIHPTKQPSGDRVITREGLRAVVSNPNVEALIIRTMPNHQGKTSRQYSGTNPPYLDPIAMDWICEKEYQHLLIDLPSVDREEDDGKLTAHKRFWTFDRVRNTTKTITELIYVPDLAEDGLYLLNLQVASIELDASPSRPMIYSLEQI